MKRFLDRKVSVIIGAPYASGILATGPGPNARYRYGIAADDIQEKVRRIQAVCARHGSSLQAVALQFPLAHPAVVAVIPGGAKPAEVVSNIGFLQEAVPRRAVGGSSSTRPSSIPRRRRPAWRTRQSPHRGGEDRPASPRLAWRLPQMRQGLASRSAVASACMRREP